MMYGKKLHEKIAIVVGGNLPAYLRYLDGKVQITSGCASKINITNFAKILSNFVG